MSLKTFVQFDVTNGSMSERMRVLHSLESTLEKMLENVENLEEEGQLTSATSLFSACLSWLETHFDIIPLVIAMALTLCVWRGMPMWKLTVSTLVISCGWEWSLMYKKVLAKKFEMMVRENGGIPAHCSPDAKSFLHRLLPGVFSNDKDCIRYQEALTVNAYLEVNPAMAVVETLSKLLLQPLGHLGEKLGIFFNEVLSANTYLASPAVAFFSVCLLVVIIVILGGYKIKLPFFLGSIEPRQNSDNSLANNAYRELTAEITDLKQALNQMIENQKQLTLVRTLPIENLNGAVPEILSTNVMSEKDVCEVDANVQNVVTRTDAIETLNEDNFTHEENVSEPDSDEAVKEDSIATVQNILSVCMESAIQKSEESCNSDTPKNDLINTGT